MNVVDIPRFVDSQIQFFWWEMDEAVLMVGLFGLGIAMGMVVTFMFLVPFAIKLLRKFKNSSLEGGGVHYLWYFGIVPLGKEFSDSTQKEFYL